MTTTLTITPGRLDAAQLDQAAAGGACWVLAPDLLQRDLTNVTPSAVLFEHAPLTEAEQVVEAVLASAEQAALLDVDTVSYTHLTLPTIYSV